MRADSVHERCSSLSLDAVAGSPLLASRVGVGAVDEPEIGWVRAKVEAAGAIRA